MKTSQIVIIIIVLVLIGAFTFIWLGKTKEVANIPAPVQNPSIVGCYVAGTSKDVYTLNIQSEKGENVSGTLAFKNFEKDSSSGTFEGTYTDGILLGDYTFRSEGMESTMQVIFKKLGDDFIRGYGDVDERGTRFTNPSNVTYDFSSPLSVFKKGECPS